ncbi:hypothetical protein [Bacillus xiapuensis]|uniref:hypothetical protein n=1 Tax=Bacillus xiapuensis TaxID=2014075 RepID=UPI000C245EDE|nr:hypothetical protein [Bacillus xiapuensis]
MRNSSLKIENREIVSIIEKLEPKIKKSLLQASYEHREDLAQEIKEKIIIKLKNEELAKIPGLFEFIEKNVR